MKEKLILPIVYDSSQKEHLKNEIELTALASKWITTRSEFIQEVWSQTASQKEIVKSRSPDDTADKIIKILTQRVFNYKSKSSISQIILKVRHNLLKQIKNGIPIHFYLLYNGGYRASSLSNQQQLIFEPDQTEMMLLYQISLLKKEIIAVYELGINFSIVVNNGVAKWVNDIPIAATAAYAKQLRKMIMNFGADNSVHVLVQSELIGFDPNFSFKPLALQSIISIEEHAIIERFLGRRCSPEEAAYRSSLYQVCEARWAQDLFPVTKTHDGIVMRQVAHSEMLSFRPFPGGAIRIQNGTFGFQYLNKHLRPKLITSKDTSENNVKWVHCSYS